MTTDLTLSEQGLTLILLENELQNNFAEVRRWQRRADEAQVMLSEARQRLTRNQGLLMRVQESISNNDCTYMNCYGYNAGIRHS